VWRTSAARSTLFWTKNGCFPREPRVDRLVAHVRLERSLDVGHASIDTCLTCVPGSPGDAGCASRELRQLGTGLTARCVRRGVMQHLVASKRYSRFSAPSTTSVEALWSGGKVWSVSKGVSPGLVGVSQRGLPQVPLPSRSQCTVAWRPSSLSLLLYGAAVAHAAAPWVLRRAPALRSHVFHFWFL